MSFCMSMAAIMDHQWIHHGSQTESGITNLIQQERHGGPLFYIASKNDTA